MKKGILFLVIALTFTMVPTACSAPNIDQQNIGDSNEKEARILELEEKLKDKDTRITELEDRLKNSASDGNTTTLEGGNLIPGSLEIVKLIKDKNFNELSKYIHPSKGVRFTPYFYIETQLDQIFTAEELAEMAENNDIFNWGVYDGIGDPIKLNFNDYYNRFIYDKDFLSPDIIGNDTIIGKGNTIDNVKEAYPDGRFVEFHFSGSDSEYGGMDWKSLRLVFEEMNGTWYIVGIIHGEWTI